MILARLEIDFRAPGEADDEVEIGVRTARVGTKSFELEYEVRQDERLVAEALLAKLSTSRAVTNERRTSRVLTLSPPGEVVSRFDRLVLRGTEYRLRRAVRSNRPNGRSFECTRN